MSKEQEIICEECGLPIRLCCLAAEISGAVADFVGERRAMKFREVIDDKLLKYYEEINAEEAAFKGMRAE